MPSKRQLVLGACVSCAVAESPYPRYGCQAGHNQYPFCDTKLPIEDRVKDLISRLTLDEKPYLMVARESPLGNISRLGVPQYDWGTNCIHGVQSRCGTSTNGETRCPTPFPNPNHLGATFNESVWHGMARIIGLELRSLWKQGVGENHPPTELPPVGLDCWSPNINIVRDPRWGRNTETASEDPFLLGRFGVQVTKGLQEGDDPKHLQAVVTLKHLVANSLDGTWDGPGGPASYPGTGLCPGGKCTRDTIDPNISAYDLASTYFPAFRMSVEEGGALGIMCSYNSVNGVPSCANDWMLGQKLRKEWGFQGYVTGDSGAVQDIWDTHYYAKTMEDAVVAAVHAGTDIQSANWPKDQPWSTGGGYIDHIPKAVRSGKLDEKLVDEALSHSLALRFRLGLFDPPEDQPYEHISPDVVRSDAHVAAAIDAVEQGLVLLKNARLANGKPVLPITHGKVALIGPHATTRYELLGNYLGQSCPELDAKGHERFYCVQNLFEAFGNLTKKVTFAAGVPGINTTDTSHFDEAVAVAQDADVVVLALGLDTVTVEKEGEDRHDITLPQSQVALFDAVQAVGKPVVVVLINGGTIAMSHIKQNADAIVEAWYPGFFGAQAIANAVMGRSNRWGKLPVTIYQESIASDLDMLDFDMTKAPGRTYRYYSGEPLWPFGFGLSYTTFALTLRSAPEVLVPQQGGQVTVSLDVLNSGFLAGDEVVMAYFAPLPGTVPADSKAAQIKRQLFGFQRVNLKAGDVARVTFQVTAKHLALFADNGDKVSYPGKYTVQLSNGLDTLETTVEVQGSADDSQPLVLEPWVPKQLANQREGQIIV